MAVALKKGIVHLELVGDREAQRKVDALRVSIGGLAGLDLQVVLGAPYARFVLEGTRPHTITARRPGGMLRFEGRGGPVFRRSVRHPGTRPNPFVQRAYERRRLEYERRIVTEQARGFNAANPHAGPRSIRLFGNILQHDVQVEAPHRTGELARSVSVRVRFTRGGI
jgi:hypothetical protein